MLYLRSSGNASEAEKNVALSCRTVSGLIKTASHSSVKKWVTHWPSAAIRVIVTRFQDYAYHLLFALSSPSLRLQSVTLF